MWEINNKLQVLSFIYSIILGFIFCFLYDIFRALRHNKRQKFVIIIIEDIIYFLIISIITFIYLLSVTNGEIRGYILFGITVGFFALYFTFSRYIFKILSKIFYLVSSFLNRMIKRFYLLFEKTDHFLMEFFKNTLKCCKILLKKIRHLLYNIKK